MESWWDCAVCALPNDPQYQTCVNCGNVNNCARGSRERFSVAMGTPVRSRLSLSPVGQRSEAYLAEEYRRWAHQSENYRGSSTGSHVRFVEEEDDLPSIAASVSRVLGGLRAAAPSAALGRAIQPSSTVAQTSGLTLPSSLSTGFHNATTVTAAPSINRRSSPWHSTSPFSRALPQDLGSDAADTRLDALQHHYLGSQSEETLLRSDSSAMDVRRGPSSPQDVVCSPPASSFTARANPPHLSSPSVTQIVHRLQCELRDKCNELLSLRLELESKTVEFERELQLTKSEARSARQENDLQRREMLVLHDEILRLTKRASELETENHVMKQSVVWKLERLLVDDSRQRVHTALDARDDAVRALGAALRLASTAIGDGLVQQRMKVSIESASLAHSHKVSELQDRVVELERLLEQRTVGGESDSK